MSEPIKTIFQLTLTFPHKISVNVAEMIAIKAQDFAQAGIIEGGFAVEGTTPDGNSMIFSEDCMHYVFGQERKQKIKN